MILPDVQVLRHERCIEVTEYIGLSPEKILEAANSVALKPHVTGARVKTTSRVQGNEVERRHTAFAKKILVEKKGTPLECLVRVRLVDRYFAKCTNTCYPGTGVWLCY